jgi:2-haloacid dehalogenase/putative hydrolase of the HAD superfamily
MALEAIFLDFYGTVVGGDRRAVEQVCGRVVTELNLETEAADFAIQWGKEFFAQIESSHGCNFATLREIEFSSLRSTLGEVGDGIDLSTFIADLDAYWANPPVHEDAVAFIKASTLPICCVSNADERPLQQAVSSLGLEFTRIVSSESVQCYKPRPSIFQSALRGMNCKPERVLHIGDSLHSDIAGASTLGIKTAWICRSDRIHDIGTSEPDWTVDTLTGLLPLIGAM